LCSGICISQTRTHIGDKCPDVLLQHIINYKTPQVRISDFKGKLLILDFWATWCLPCVAMIPTNNALQNKFNGRIQILPVTDQDSATVTSFFTNMNHVQHFSPPCVTGDKVLHSMFSHTVIPHYVWIDENGTVAAITDEESLNEQTIRGFLEGKTQTLTIKNDAEKIIDNNKPMFGTGITLVDNNGGHFEETPNADLLYHSVITKYMDGFGCESGTMPFLINAKNNSIGGLYRIAAGHDQLKYLSLNSTTWEVTNSNVLEFTDSASLLSLHTREATDSWMRHFTFCYELKFPPALGDRKFDVMLADLNNYFGAMYRIRGSLERRNAPCLALMRFKENIPLETNINTGKNVLDAFRLKLSGTTINALINYLGMHLDLYPPIIDETGYNGKLDIDLKCDLTDLTSVNEALAAYGLRLQQKYAERDVIVISDTK